MQQIKLTVTVTQEEYDKQRAFCYNEDSVFEIHLKQQIQNYSVCKDHNVKCYERFTKAQLMLQKLQVEKYDLTTVQLAGKGVDRYLDYLEYKDGTPLSFEEIEAIKHNYKLHDYIIS